MNQNITEMKTEEIETLDNFNKFLDDGIELARKHEDKAFVGLLKAIRGYANNEPLPPDPQKALHGMIQRQQNYPEREEYLEGLINVIKNAPFCNYAFSGYAIVVMEFIVSVFQTDEGVFRFGSLLRDKKEVS